ncbi:unnamed protein product [Rhizophagus irregularis]|nr:unnamed protein product [Rhizophagus irregularis]
MILVFLLILLVILVNHQVTNILQLILKIMRKNHPDYLKKLKIENDVQSDYEKEFIQQQSNIGTNDEVQNNPGLHSEQDKSEILDGLFIF